MIRQLRYATLALFLASCATVLDGQIQDVTIETVGANNTLCYMQNNEFSFRFYPPQTLKVTKSSDPYTIRCLAPGNREKTIVVAPEIGDDTYYNVANLGTGVAVDHLSSAMYKLPDKIVISFEGQQPSGYSQPHYNNFFDKNPQIKGVEEFRPGQAALMRDANTIKSGLKPHVINGEESSFVLGSEGQAEPMTNNTSNTNAPVQVVPAVMAPVPAGSSGMNADLMTRSMNLETVRRLNTGSSGCACTYTGPIK